MNSDEFEINFTDITLNETDGVFDDTKKIMEKEFPYNKKWALRTDIVISGLNGECYMEAQFNGKGEVYIVDYSPSIGDLFYNPDIQVISMWSQENGWKVPQPHPDLIKENKDFWKYFYDTLIIDSDYFDELYGKRPQLQGEDEDG
jgi:hypothetical protein